MAVGGAGKAGSAPVVARADPKPAPAQTPPPQPFAEQAKGWVDAAYVKAKEAKVLACGVYDAGKDDLRTTSANLGAAASIMAVSSVVLVAGGVTAPLVTVSGTVGVAAGTVAAGLEGVDAAGRALCEDDFKGIRNMVIAQVGGKLVAKAAPIVKAKLLPVAKEKLGQLMGGGAGQVAQVVAPGAATLAEAATPGRVKQLMAKTVLTPSEAKELKGFFDGQKAKMLAEASARQVELPKPAVPNPTVEAAKVTGGEVAKATADAAQTARSIRAAAAKGQAAVAPVAQAADAPAAAARAKATATASASSTASPSASPSATATASAATVALSSKAARAQTFDWPDLSLRRAGVTEVMDKAGVPIRGAATAAAGLRTTPQTVESFYSNLNSFSKQVGNTFDWSAGQELTRFAEKQGTKALTPKDLQDLGLSLAATIKKAEAAVGSDPARAAVLTALRQAQAGLQSFTGAATQEGLKSIARSNIQVGPDWAR